MTKVRNAFDRERLPYICDSESLCHQSFKEECDINNIMAKYRKTGLLSHVNRYQGDYSDVSDGFSYQEALDRVRAANDMFMSLPAEVRSKFDNDAGRFLDFVSDPANEQEMKDMGLMKAGAEAAPVVPAPPVVPADKPPEEKPKA